VAQAQQGAKDGQWRSYGGDNGSTKYSPLDQINQDTVKDLRIAWRWRSPDNALRKGDAGLYPFIYEATPLMVNGVLYTSTSFSLAAALDGATGKTLWVYDPKSYAAGRPTNLGFVHRGLAYWTDGKDERLFLATGNAFLIALDARTGQPCPDFGDHGKIDLTKGLRRPVERRLYAVTSPPVICRDVVVMGSSIFDLPPSLEMPPGDVRGFDARTGKLLWTFHTVPQEGEFGNQTWENGSWKYTGNTNVWTLMSADDELGYVYLPVSTPSNDFYGGHRHGDNLFAESIVCLEARTGKRVWHFQTVHHGVWDYDLPAAPTLVDLTVAGRQVKALAQVTKQGFCFVLDRVTGKPVWPIEERPVPQSQVAGEKTSPTQPFPTKPPPFERQGLTANDLIDFTPELRQEALAIVSKYDYGPLFLPPTERGTINVPGWNGGANWQGAAFDPETERLYVPSITSPIKVSLTKPFFGRSGFRYVGALSKSIDGPRGLPLVKPPYGRLTAIDLSRGEHVWMIPLGDGPLHHPALKDLNLPPLGSPHRGRVLATRSLLFVGQEGPAGEAIAAIRSGGDEKEAQEAARLNRKFQALDKATGKRVWEINLPTNVTGSPLTYLAGGRQYIVFAIGGLGQPAELVALSLAR
jgi:quinoprotein glucose dehydrogenase